MKYLNLFIVVLISCTVNRTVQEEKENLISSTKGEWGTIIIDFEKGKSFNHPSFAIWLEGLEGNYIETLFVTRFAGTGEFGYGEVAPGRWDNKPGEVRRPASLPYWSHKRGIRASDGLYIPSHETPVQDAITGATPKGNFRMEIHPETNQTNKFRLLMEINQPWDSNRFWNNSKFPGDPDYFTSLQPALVYAVTIDPQNTESEYYLNPIGHSHPSGKNGELFTNLSTITTAKEIASKIIVSVKRKP